MNKLSRRDFIKYAAIGAAGFACAPICGCRNTATEDTTSSSLFKIGGIGPVTGSYSVYGVSARFGAQVAIDELNAKGFNKYELNWQDNQSIVNNSAYNYDVLRDWGAQMIVGPLTTNEASVVAKKAYADNLFMVTPSASSSKVLVEEDTDKTRRKNVFQSCCSDITLGKTAAQSISKYAPHARVGVAYNKISNYSSGLAKAFLDEAKTLGLRVVVVDTYSTDDNKSFGIEIDDAIRNNVHLWFIPDYYAQTAAIITQSSKLDYHPLFMGADGIDAILTLEGFNENLAEGVLGLSTFTPNVEDEKVELFVDKYKQLVDGSWPLQVAAEAYDAIYLLDSLITKAQVEKDLDPSEISDLLVDTILDDEFVFSGLTGSDIKWDTSGRCNKTSKLMHVVDGCYIPAEIND